MSLQDKIHDCYNHNYLLENSFNQKQYLKSLKENFLQIFWNRSQKYYLGWSTVIAAVAPEIINELTILMNCFPVINTELNEFSQLLTQGINIIPLTTEDMFFDIRWLPIQKAPSINRLIPSTTKTKMKKVIW